MKRQLMYGLLLVIIVVIANIYKTTFWVMLISILLLVNMVIYMYKIHSIPPSQFYDSDRADQNQDSLVKLLCNDWDNRGMTKKEFGRLYGILLYSWHSWNAFDSFPNEKAAKISYDRRRRVSEFFELYHLRRDYKIPSIYVYELLKKHFLQEECNDKCTLPVSD